MDTVVTPPTALPSSVFVAEDDLATSALLRATLERADYEVRHADDGADALAQILRVPPDVALLDIGMPGLDGLQVTRALRRSPTTALLPIILVTARGRLEDKVAGLDAGASDFITKPFEPAELLARVRSNLRLSAALSRLESAQDVLVALASAVDAKDSQTEHHCGRVAEASLKLAKLFGLAGEQLEAVGYGAVLHDVGKIGIADYVLTKPGVLTPEERVEMQKHPLVGAAILRPLRIGRLVEPIVRGHHERFDGAGYPDGLRGETIPLGARIVTVVDSYDAMTHNRPYREALSEGDARDELLRHKGSQFDPTLVDLFLESIDAPPTADAELDAVTRGLRYIRGDA